MPPESSLEIPQIPDSDPHVLFVDDEANLRNLFLRALGGSGIPHTFQSAATGIEAAHLLIDKEPGGFSNAAGPRLLITDYQLHGDGKQPDLNILNQIARGELSPDNFCFDGPALVCLARTVEDVTGITNRAVTILLSGGNFDQKVIQNLLQGGELDAYFSKPPPARFAQNLLSLLTKKTAATHENDPRILGLTTPMRDGLVEEIFSPKDMKEINDIVGRFSSRLLGQTPSS